MNTKGLNREIIKYIAIITMTFNHIAHVLLTPGTILFEVFEDIGYFTAITMCYFLVEGYHYTRSKEGYAKRLLIFAFISQIPYNLAADVSQLNMLFTLYLCFRILWVMENVNESSKKRVAIMSLTLVTVFCDWALIAAIFTIMFEKSRNDKKRQIRAFTASAALFWGISFLSLTGAYSVGMTALHALFSTLGIMASGIILLVFYNGKKSERNSELNKWFFYIYYPAHLMILLLIKGLLYLS